MHEHYLLAKQFKMPDLLKNHTQPRNRTNDNAAVAQSKAWKNRCVLESALLYASLMSDISTNLTGDYVHQAQIDRMNLA